MAPPGRWIIGPGDREVDMKRLEAQVAPAVPSPFEEDDFTKHPELVKGTSPQVLGKSRPRASSIWSTRGSCGTAWITGANEPGRHVP